MFYESYYLSECNNSLAVPSALNAELVSNGINTLFAGPSAIFSIDSKDLIAISSLALWGIVSLFSFKFHAKTLWYSLGFAISYMLTNLSMILALKHGPLSLTSLFFQL